LIELGNIPKHGSPPQNELDGVKFDASPTELCTKSVKTKS